MRQNKIRKSCLFSIVLALAACGCASQSKPAPTPKEEAVKQWNDARATVMLGLARDQYKEGHFDKARETVNQSLSLAPDYSLAHILSAKLYIEIGQLEAAERELATARQLEPTNAEAEYLSGVIYQRWQQPARALEFYEHACEKSPAELGYLMARAEMLVAMDRRTEALSLLQEKVIYFEHSAVIRDAVGLLLLQQGHIADAVEMLSRATILAPDDLTIREHLATGLYYAKRYAECADALSRLVKETKYQNRPDLLMMMAECQLQTGRADDARENFLTVAAAMPSMPGIWLSLARTQLQLNELRAADISLHRGMALNPNEAESYLLLGYLRLKQSRPPEALEAFEQASQLAPEDTTSLCMIGYTLDKLGKGDQALAYYGRALKIDPKDEMATQLMARLDLHE